jgi:SAM-dependent methyltransferase
MRHSVVEILRTPASGQALRLEIFRKIKREPSHGWINCREHCAYLNRIPSGGEPCDFCVQEEIIDGRLISEDGEEEYPVIDGIPRLLPSQYMVKILKRHSEWFEKYGRLQHHGEITISRKSIEIQQRTSERFGKEWETFDRLIDDFEEVFEQYFDLVDLDGLSGKTVMDAGCGMGRWAFYMAPKVRRIVAFDLSSSVEMAYRNCFDRGNVEIIQADVYHLPFLNESFDFIYCLGVLHHLPEPFMGFLSLKKLLAKNGKILLYLYYNLENRPLYFRVLKNIVNLVRMITTRIPIPFSYSFSFAVAVGIYLPVILLGNLLNAIGLEKVSTKLPLYQFYKSKSFRLILNDAIDRFTAPVENRYSKNDIIKWFKDAGFSDWKFSESPPYWKTIGKLGCE